MKTSTIANYWDKQATIWREEKDDAWHTPETKYWIEYFKNIQPSLSGNKVLEVGTASGYFANILILSGYDVIAIDLSTAMIEEAKSVSNKLNIEVDYRVMDAQSIDLEPNSFDLIFTRLMTWTLPNVHQFYTSCFELLKHNGTLINFDGDMGKITFSSEDGHDRYPKEIMEEANTIKSQLEVNRVSRPQYDLDTLQSIGFNYVEADLNLQNQILYLEDSSSLFQIKAIKN